MSWPLLLSQPTYYVSHRIRDELYPLTEILEAASPIFSATHFADDIIAFLSMIFIGIVPLFSGHILITGFNIFENFMALYISFYTFNDDTLSIFVILAF